MKIHMNYKRTTLGILLILCAVIITLDALGVYLGFFSGIPATTLILASFCFLWFLTNLVRLKIAGLFIPLACIFVLFEKYIASALSLESKNIIDNWIVFVVAILLNCGFSILLPKRSSKFSFGRSFYIDGNIDNLKKARKTESSENEGEKRSHKSKNSMSNSTVYIDCSSFVSETVTNEMGSCEVYFTNIDKYVGNGVLTVSNRLGYMGIHVPSGWTITNAVGNSLGSVESPRNVSDGDLSIVIDGSNELGSLEIMYE